MEKNKKQNIIFFLVVALNFSSYSKLKNWFTVEVYLEHSQAYANFFRKKAPL